MICHRCNKRIDDVNDIAIETLAAHKDCLNGNDISGRYEKYFLVQRKERSGWRTIRIPKKTINEAILSCEKIKEDGFTFPVRVVLKESVVVWEEL